MEFWPGSMARLATAGSLVLFLCWQHVQATRLGYKVEAARKTLREQRSRVADLRMNYEERLSPARIAAQASRLGLVPAAPDALRHLQENDLSDRSMFQRLWGRRLTPLLPVPRA